MRIGLVGAGSMGVTHAAGWATTDATLTGILCETCEEAEGLAGQYHLPVYSTLDELLQHVDVVDICAPTHLHYEMVLKAAAANKPIICEKPLARTVDQGREMVAACKHAGVPLLVAHVVRYFPEYALAHSRVAAGHIGKPARLRLQRASYRPKKPAGNWFLDFEKSGGMMLDLMVHDFDYARWIAGDVESVFARSVDTEHPDAPIDYAMAILRHRNGALSHVTGGWAYPPPEFRTGFDIAGDAGLIEWESSATQPIEMLLTKSSDPNAPDVALPGSPVSESPYTTEIKEFYAALKGEKTARVTAEDGLAAVQIALAAIESARTGQPVHLNPLAEVQA